MSPKPSSSWSKSARAAPAELRGAPQSAPKPKLIKTHARQVPRLCRKTTSCTQTAIESKTEATGQTLPLFCCRDLSAGPARGRFGRPSRLGTAPWSPDGSNLVPSNPQKQPFRSRVVLNSQITTFLEMLPKSRIHDHKVVPKCRPSRPRAGPRAPEQPL